MTRARIGRALFAIAAFATLMLAPAAQPAHAQLGLTGIGSSLSISLSPQYPAPGQTVALTAQSATLDLANSALTWTVNGTVVARGTGVVQASVVAGGLGSRTQIALAAATPEGIDASASATIAPTSIDLLYDADSYVPPFYRGRALPSPGSSLIVEARPQFVRTNGGAVSRGDITYTWKRDNQVLTDLSGQGKYAIAIPAPVPYGSYTVSVEAHTTDGSLAGLASVRVRAADPLVELYVDDPLFGIRYRDALDDAATIADPETSFIAIPYFVTAAAANAPALEYQWRINGVPVAADTANPNALTIQAAAAGTTATVQLALTHVTNYLLDLKRSWQLHFSRGSGTTTQDPFSTSTQ